MTVDAGSPTGTAAPVATGIAGPTGQRPSGGWFPVLDTLRAVGALAVLTTHTAFWAGSYTTHGYVGAFLARLDVGVALFFVLSGFLLARPHLAAARTGARPPALGAYVRHRFWRIAPLAVVTVALALSLVEGAQSVPWREKLAALTLTSIYTVEGGFPAGTTHLWSLSTEIAFYVVLPLVMLLAVGRGGRAGLRPARLAAVVGGSVAVSVAWFLLQPAVESHVPFGQPHLWLPGYLVWFGAGIGLAAAYELGVEGRGGRVVAALRGLAAQPGVCWGLAVGLMLVAATPLAGPSMLAATTPGAHVVKTLLYTVVATLVVLTGVFASSPGYTRALSHPAARRLGVVSYGIFCLHLPVLHLVMWTTGWPVFEGRFLAIWSLTLLISYAAAEASYRWIEAPAQRFARRRG